jgi:hypothetical protein
MSVIDEAIKIATTGLDFKKSNDRLKGACVKRRANRLHDLNTSWSAAKLATQLKAELTAITDYIKTKDTLIAGTETTQPAHLDLRDVAYAVSGMGSFAKPFVEAGEKEYRANRTRWISQIVWRAVAIHTDLWENEGYPPKLAEAALNEILDRRLRAVEQMTCNVNAPHGAQLKTIDRTWKISGPNGPWRDDNLVRNFEYPVLPKDQFDAYLPQMTEWKEKYGLVIVFTPPQGQAPIYFPKDIRSSWRVSVTPAGTMWVVYQPSPSRKAADVIRRMFSSPRTSFQERNWLYCDMVVSVLSIEALWLGNHRRRGDDVDFEEVANKPDYMQLGPVVQFDRTHDLDRLMIDDHDPFFENLELDIDNLEIGDFVCFWSSRIYDLIVPDGAWRNEFSLIMGIDVDGVSGKVRILTNGPQIWLAGHGIDTVLYSGMADNLVTWIGNALKLLRAELFLKLKLNGDPTEITTELGQKLVLWTPYEKFDPPGAWWLKIPKSIWRDDWDFASVGDVLKAVPRTVAKEDGGTGYNPPEAETIYFPLYEPVVTQTDADGDSWRAYLRKRKANATFRVPSVLSPLNVDSRLASGLFYRGSITKIPVVRPKVRK